MKNDGMPLACAEWAEKLATGRLATLSPTDSDALNAHLVSCKACRAAQREYDEMDRRIGKVSCAKTLTGLPPQLLRLWEEQNRQVALYASLRSGTSTKPREVIAGEPSYLTVVPSQDTEPSSPPTSSTACLSALNLSVLTEHCMREISKYRRGEPFTDEYSVELFRRVTVQRDQEAWQWVQQCFSQTVLSWIHRHPKREAVCRLESEEKYVAQTFARFWQATANNQKLEFSTLSAALRYLHASLNSAILDTLRAYSRPGERALPESAFQEEAYAQDQEDSRGVLEVIGSLIPDVREQRLAYLLFHYGLKPREIVHYCPQEFNNVREVYCLRRNILERLQRNADLTRWRLGDKE